MANLNVEVPVQTLTSAILRGVAEAINQAADKIDNAQARDTEHAGRSQAKKAAPKKEVQEELPQDDQMETGVDLGFDTELPEEDDKPKVTLNDVIKGFQLYAKEKGKDKAAKVLAKYKVKSVRELKAENYAKVLSEIEV